MSNHQPHVPGGVVLGLAGFIEHLKQWIYLSYNVFAIQVSSPSRGISYWQMTEKEEPGFLLNLRVGFRIDFEGKSITLSLVVENESVEEVVNFERMDLRGDQTSVNTAKDEFKARIHNYLCDKKNIQPIYPKTEKIGIRRLTKRDAYDIVEVTAFLKNGEKFIMFTDTQHASTISKRDHFIKTENGLVYQPETTLH